MKFSTEAMREIGRAMMDVVPTVSHEVRDHYAKIYKRGFALRFIDPRERHFIGNRIAGMVKFMFSAERWGIEGGQNHPDRVITRVGPIAIDTLPSRRTLFARLLDARKATTYWHDRATDNLVSLAAGGRGSKGGAG